MKSYKKLQTNSTLGRSLAMRSAVPPVEVNATIALEFEMSATCKTHKHAQFRLNNVHCQQLAT